MKESSGNNGQPRESYASRLGMLMVLIGGSVGLGNIWKFPYMTGANGGACFLLIYFAVILIFGIPMIMLELSIGRKTRKPIVPALKELRPNGKWYLIGYYGVTVCCLVYAEYVTVSGWSLAYAIKALTGEFIGQTPDSIAGAFIGFIGNGPLTIFYMLLILVISAGIVCMGVQKGLERISKFLMPLLYVCLIVLAVRAVTLPNAMDGIRFFLMPDFRKVNGSVVLAAFGQAFFSLGLGLGATTTLGSYGDGTSDMVSDTCFVAGGDSAVAFLAGFVVFPCVFAYGMSPEAGPSLVFITLNSVFAQMPGGRFFGVVFYLLLLLAIFTSTITILQVIVAHFVENAHMSTKRAAVAASVIGFLVGLPYCLGFGLLSNVQIFGRSISDLCDLLLNIGTPLGALMLCVFVGWIWGTDASADTIGLKAPAVRKIWHILIRYCAPIIILGVLVSGI